MSVSDQFPFNNYTANGVTTVFAFSFYLGASADLVVQVAGATKTLGADYSISGVGAPSGGSVTFATPPAASSAVSIYRDTDLSRATDYQNNGDLRAATLNADLDRPWLALQEVVNGGKVGVRAMRAPLGETLNELPASTARADSFLRFDGGGQPVAYLGDPTSSTALAADLASTAAGKGAALVGMQGAGTLQGWRNSQKVVNLLDQRYGVVQDRTVDNTAAIQAAFSDLQDGGALYIPKQGLSGTAPSYKITGQITCSKSNITIFSDPRTEYGEGFYTDQNITMFLFTGYGVKIQSVQFQGNGTESSFATTNAVVFDRRSTGDAETYSNLDCDVQDCGFFLINDAIRGVGRNVFVMHNIFAHCKRGVVGEIHTYSGGTLSSVFRGWRISYNRFHSCGAPYIVSSSETLPATLADLDSWCIQMPQTTSNTSNLEIKHNNADLCGAGFYKGYLAETTISGNQTDTGNAIFAYAVITDTANQNVSLSYISAISENTLNARTVSSTATRGYQFCESAIVVSTVHNLTIANNRIRATMYEPIKVTTSERLKIRGNDILNGNNAFTTDATTRPAVSLTGGSNTQYIGNTVMSSAGTVYSAGLACLTSSPNIKIRDNTHLQCVTEFSVPATNLAKANDDGLPWQTPTMTNGYTYTSGYGYRRTFDGKVQISVLLATGTGTDNASAFTLPTGYRPAQDVYLPAVGIYSHVYAFIRAATGEVFLNWETTAPSSYSINVEYEAA